MIGIVYRPPTVPLPQNFVDDFSRFAHLYININIMGDFNCNMLVNDNDSIFINNFVFSHDLYLCNEQPTHHTSYSQTLLDLCIIDSTSKMLILFYLDMTKFTCYMI